jgi:hypothetical protein
MLLNENPALMDQRLVHSFLAERSKTPALMKINICFSFFNIKYLLT